MKSACRIASVVLIVLVCRAAANDLKNVPRTIATEPEYQAQPRYCLLVFGAEAATRVWLVHDKDTLYADLNGDGDLTDPAERIASHPSSEPDDGVFRFDVGHVRDGNRLHKSLSVMTLNLDHMADADVRIRNVLARDSEARFYRLGIDLEVPGRRGAGIEGRVEHIVSAIDAGGVLSFADSPQQAPVIHFGGPWQITLFSGAQLTVGRQTEVFLGLGTPGLGAGTTAFAAYQDLVPAGKFPKLRVTLPGDADDAIDYVLRERCCTVNFHGGVRLPDDAPTGEATVRISFDEWFGGFAAPTTHQVKVVPPKVKITLDPVSSRLKGSLMHPSREGEIVGVRYSPDGRRIIAGDYPGGIVQMWDVETGVPLTTIETGYGLRSSSEYFHLTPDWQSMYVSRRKREITQVERDGKRMNRWECDGDVRCWDLETGELLSRRQHTPPRNIILMQISPDGRFLLTGDELPGEYEGRPSRRVSLWNLATAARREFSNVGLHCVFSADGSRFAAAEQSAGFFNTALKLFDTQSGQQTLSIPITEQSAQAVVMDFSPDNSLLIGRVVIRPDVRDRTTQQSTLNFWDTGTGEQVGSIMAKHQGETFSWPAAFSPDGQTYAVGNWRGERAELYLIDVASRQIAKTIDLGEGLMLRGQVFSPDGQWIAATTQSMPDNVSPYTTAEDLPQPRIHLIESTTGNVRETMEAPQCFLAALCFSPDGRTLATGGPGRVLLWDLSTPPGEWATQ